MKRIIAIFSAVLALGMLSGCVKETYPTLDENGIPVASELKVRHTIDETNIVTFYVDNKGVVPYFIFDDGTTKSGQGVSRRFAEAGDYSVEVKAYNANGMSDGSLVYSFNVPVTYHPPFDPTKFMNFLTGGSSKKWVIASDVQGHMGCGPDGGNAAGWWSAAPNDKAAWSVYDNVLTFNADGTYQFDPVDGQIYVNKGCSYHSELYLNDDQDYLAPIDVQNTTFTLSGITDVETLITFPANTTIGYIPNDECWNNPVFYITDISATQLTLVCNNTGISWQFIFKPYVAGPSFEDKLAGTWALASDVQGHMGCGPDAGNAAGWWSAGPNEKAAWSVYDNTLTFTADGKYTFDPGDGQIYVNKDCSYHHELYLNDDQDYLAPIDVQNTTYKVVDDGVRKSIVFPAETTIGYIPNDEAWNDPTFIVAELTDDQLTLVSEDSGISWQFIYKRIGGGAPKTFEELLTGGDKKTWVLAHDDQGHMGCGPDADNPLGWWNAAPNDKKDWSVYDNKLTFGADGSYTFNPGDGQIYVNKECSYHSELYKGDDQDYLAPYDLLHTTYTIADDGVRKSIVFPANTTIGYIPNDLAMENPTFIVTSISEDRLILVSDKPGTIAWQFVFMPADELDPEAGTPAPEIPAYDSDKNLWKAADASHTIEQYTATGDNWASLPNPEVTDANDGTYSFTYSKATSQKWQAQFKILPTSLSASSAKKYCLSATVVSSTDVAAATIKMGSKTKENEEPHMFLAEGSIPLQAGTPLTYTFSEPVAGIDDEVELVFDFGGCPENTTITINNIVFWEAE